MKKTVILSMIFCGLISIGARAEDSVGMSMASGTAGAGAHIDYTRTQEMDGGGGRYVNARAGFLGDRDAKFRMTGNVGVFAGNGWTLGDPQLVHSNGAYTHGGISPLLGLGVGVISDSLTFHVAPKWVLVHDHRLNREATGYGIQGFISAKVGEKVRVTVIGQMSDVSDRDHGDGSFVSGEGSIDIKVNKNLSVSASAEVSDLNLLKELPAGGSVESSAPAALYTLGAKGIF